MKNLCEALQSAQVGHLIFPVNALHGGTLVAVSLARAVSLEEMWASLWDVYFVINPLGMEETVYYSFLFSPVLFCFFPVN